MSSKADMPMFMSQTNYPAKDRPATVTMSSLREISRPLLVFSPSNADPRLLTQMRWFARGYPELHDRQVLLVPVTVSDKAETAEVFPREDCVHLTAEEAAMVRQRLHIAPGAFTVVLLGKDGGEKFRSHAPVTIEKLDVLIDAMPMRQQEVRNGHAK